MFNSLVFYLTRAGLIAYPAPFIIQFKFKQLVLGLQVKLAASEDRASGFGWLCFCLIFCQLATSWVLLLFRRVPTNTGLDSTELGWWEMISEAPLFICPPPLLMAAVLSSCLINLGCSWACMTVARQEMETWQPRLYEFRNYYHLFIGSIHKNFGTKYIGLKIYLTF